MFLGRISTARRSLCKSALRLLDPRVSSATACRELLQSIPRRWKGEAYVRMPDKCPHVLIVAPSRTGKGASLIVPLLLMCGDSMIVHDTKGELYKITATARRRMGHRVVKLAPWDKDSDHLNPLEFIDPDSDTVLDDCRDIAKSVVQRTGKEHETFWHDMAEIFIAGMTAATVSFLEPSSRNLQSVRDLLADATKRQRAIDMMCASNKWDGLLSRWGHELRNCTDKTLSGVLSTAATHLSFLDTPAVHACTIDSTFHVDDIKRRKVTVYICLPPDRIRAQMGLARLWLTTCMRAVVKQGLGGSTVRVVLDEAAALGRLDQLDDLVDKYAGYNLKSVFVYQSMGQLGRCWEDGGQTLLSNTAQIFFAVNDPATAEYVSKRLGSETVAVEGGGWNWGGSYSTPEGGAMGGKGGTIGTSWGGNTGWNQVKVRLLLPEQVLTLPERLAIVFVPSTPPVAVGLVRYYEDELFQKPRLGRQTFAALCTLLASIFVLCLSILLVFASVSLEPRATHAEPVRPVQGPQHGPKVPPNQTNIFGNPD